MDCKDVAIKIANVSKIYKLYEKPVDRLKEALNPFGKKYHKDFYAVKNVSFDVKKGEALGLIGKNGSGKSTLLKMITGVLTPSSGHIYIDGKVSALLELGAGFNPEYTGIENVYFNASLLGYSKQEIDKKIDEILSFADIGDFVYQPVKIYSSGMFVRLAFAVAIHTDPDILIVDEALSVGDIRFQQKCLRKIAEFKQNKTIMFVSHDLGVICNYCDRAIWINNGEIIEDGPPEEVSKKYKAFMSDSHSSKYMPASIDEEKKEEDIVDPLDNNLDSFGDGKVDIIGISVINADTGEKLSLITSGQHIKLLIKIKANAFIESPIVGFTIKDRLGNTITQSNSYVLGETISSLTPNQVATFCFEFQLPYLNNGVYTISPAVASGTQEDHVQHCWVHDALLFQVVNKKQFNLEGILTIPQIDFFQIN